MRDNEIIKILNSGDYIVQMPTIFCWERSSKTPKEIGLFDVIDLINRLQSENERLNGELLESNIEIAELYKCKFSADDVADNIVRAKAKSVKEFSEKVVETLKLLNEKELSGVGREYDDIFGHQNPMAWTRGSITARNEAIAVIVNTSKEMVGEQI